jgi:hypothetical protein
MGLLFRSETQGRSRAGAPQRERPPDQGGPSQSELWYPSSAGQRGSSLLATRNRPKTSIARASRKLRLVELRVLAVVMRPLDGIQSNDLGAVCP